MTARKTGKPAVSVLSLIAYGVLLAAGALFLQWIEYAHLARFQSGGLLISLLALVFLVLGIWVGAQLFRKAALTVSPGNPEARSTLGISDREYEVLELLAAGQSNKEIARTLGVSPNTVKTHVSRLLEKLDARRRTEAVSKARALRIVD
ncbi:DNA-binding response regulator [Henriciella barbarensis]|uniref:DNA-binding response regulator n=1 Tax=Henriciella barbarensis TaxID=86342 RepID=A0A399R155_9PROT|nr:response regulator transcription factor [Henriciella barbarensis]RIJ24521.1 DNA-binding response regulator [Henriciella barbarensis]